MADLSRKNVGAGYRYGSNFIQTEGIPQVFTGRTYKRGPSNWQGYVLLVFMLIIAISLFTNFQEFVEFLGRILSI